MKITNYIVAFVVLGLALPSVAANWTWQLPVARYQRLNQFERAQYDKAAKLYEQRQYDAAAAEFEKFRVQFEDSDEIAYILVMRGLSLHHANNRNTAIKVFQDVIDYFSTSEKHRDDVVAATYWRGVSYLESGDMLNGLRVMKRMVENPDFKEHILTAGALRRLANNHFANKEYDQAVRYWQQTIRDFRKLNDEEVRDASSDYAAYTVVSNGYKAYDAFFMNIATEKEREPENINAYRVIWVEALYNRAYGLYHHHEWWRWRKVWPLDRDETKHKALLAAEQKAYYEYIRSHKATFEGANRTWQYYERCTQILCQTWGERAEREKVTQEAVTWIKAQVNEKTEAADKRRQDQHYARMIEMLSGARESQLARFVKAQMNDRLLAEYNETHILYAEGKHREAVTVLEGVEAAAKGDLAVQALHRRGWFLKDVIGDYDAAIKAYSSMTNPPWNLWHVAECYQRWSGNGRDATKFRQAINQLAEIEASFPNDAPRAAWSISHWYANSGDQRNAVAAARRILRQYPKSGYASHAHLYLEGLGITDGGGGVSEEIK